MIAGYENQLLEFAVENPEDWEQLKDDIVLIYPTPTVWSSHIYIALDEAGEAGIDALMDEEIQRLAWENHGFRTEVSGTEQTKTTSASPTWPRRSHRWPPCPATPPWRRSSPLCRRGGLHSAPSHGE